MPAPTRQATPGPSTTVNGALSTQLPENQSKKRSGSEVIEDTRDAKKVKVDSSGPLSTVSVNGKQREKEKKKKKRKKKTRRTSVVAAILQPVPLSRQTSVAASTSILRPTSPEPTNGQTKDTVDGETSSNSSDKGKGKAKSQSPLRRVTTPPPSEQPVASGSGSSSTSSDQTSEINRLKEQLASQTALLKRHQNHMNTHQQSLTCQICLDLMHKPYALIPCGHITCYGCLVRWFTAVPEIPGGVNVPDPQNDNVDAILNGPTARNGAHIRRRKNCPVCRAVVVQRPVEMWGIKSMVATLVKSGLADLPTPVNQPVEENVDNNHDPWKNIFRRAGSSNAQGHHYVPFDPRMLPFAPPLPAPPPNPEENRADMGWYDAEDGGIYRCNDCYHEILFGRCTACRRAYPGHARHDDDDSDSDDDDDGHFDDRYREGLDELMALLHGDPHVHDEDDSGLSDEEDGYGDGLWPDGGEDSEDGEYPELYPDGADVDVGDELDTDDDEAAAVNNFFAIANEYFGHAPRRRGPRPAARIEEVAPGEDEDEEGSDYEGSFIDDGEDHEEDNQSDDEVIFVDDDNEDENDGSEDDAGDGVDALDRPPGQPQHERQRTPIRFRPEGMDYYAHRQPEDVDDDEDDDEDEVEEVPNRVQRRGRRVIVEDDSENDEELDLGE
ncbi:hypothetical protein BDN70DRAFT_988564 [Pholiota conissans]|uniref:RING-type domain-containing protein n=1 Tax=Pholiota conissans TaxID=109636 RepID=A0A9P5ZDC8_9AGAR|nr:hypothetical protein BDN70DRAFT_988564 [Pholiota conissans]